MARALCATVLVLAGCGASSTAIATSGTPLPLVVEVPPTTTTTVPPLPPEPEPEPEPDPPPPPPPPAPKARTAPTTTTTERPAVAGDESVWDRLAQCESSGNWAANTGNGYTGGLQFVTSTWLSNGGGAYAPAAYLASREEQIEVAIATSSGGTNFRPWPACARKLGLS